MHARERIVFGTDAKRILAMCHQAGALAQWLHPGGALIGGAERGRLAFGRTPDSPVNNHIPLG